MTTITSNTAALASLSAYYAQANSHAGNGTALTSSQESSMVAMVQGSSDASTGLSALLGSTDGTTSSTDLSGILDAIQAQTDASVANATAGTTSSSATGSTTATSSEQKAIAMMQSVYQSQQANLFTLLG
jgi:hypothetical protein